MIFLYINDNCSFCDEVQSGLQELVVSHRIRKIRDASELPEGIYIPAIQDDDQWFSGEQQIRDYLEQLKVTVREWRKFQSDSCYLDDDGEIC